MKNYLLKSYVKGKNYLYNVKTGFQKTIDERGSSEMVAVVVLIVMVIAVSLAALPKVRETLINSFKNIVTGMDEVGSTTQ